MLRFIATLALIVKVLVIAQMVQAQDPQYAKYDTPKNASDNNFVAHKEFEAEPYAVGDISRFMFADWTGAAIPVWVYVPTNTDLKQAPILFMMHGAKRNPARYLLEWAPVAEENGFVVVAPEFSKRDFRGSRRYQRGGVSRRVNGDYIPVDESEWAFSAIEPLFDHTVATLESEQAAYTIYGHSAGAQFVHRFMYYKPEARVKRYIAANSGWYTMPDMGIDYPFGLNDSGVPEEVLKAAFGKSVMVMLGDKDISTTSSSLSKTAGSMLQGEHRYNRGITFMETAREQSESLGVDLAWRGIRVKGVGHSNSGMAKASAPFVE